MEQKNKKPMTQNTGAWVGNEDDSEYSPNKKPRAAGREQDDDVDDTSFRKTGGDDNGYALSVKYRH